MKGGDKATRHFQFALTDEKKGFEAVPPRPGDVLPMEDFVHELVTNLYIYRPNGRLCSGFSVNRRVAPVQDGVKVKANGDEEPNWVLAADWIARVSAVEQMSWVPGQDEFIEDKLINNGGWFAHEGSRIYNLYKGPVRVPRVGTIEPWVNHIKALWGEEARQSTFSIGSRLRFNSPGSRLITHWC